jgi:hypothetical protein
VKSAKKAAPKVPKEFKFGPASYRWNANSCWLDASLQVLYIAITKQFDEFTGIFKSLEPGSALNVFYRVVNERFELDPEEPNFTTSLGLQRDRLRIFLNEKKIIDHQDRPESAVVRLEICISITTYFHM